MRNIRDVLRLKLDAKLTHRQVAKSLSIATGTISLYLNRAREVGLSWPLPEDMDDAALEKALFPNIQPATQSGFIEPDYALMHQELKKKV